MRRLFCLLVSYVGLGCAVAAHATTISAGVYNLENAYADGYAVTGTVTFNSSGNATAANLIFDDASLDDPGLPNVNQVYSTSVYNGLSQNYLTSSSNSGQIALYLNTTADSSGHFDLCIGSAQCGTAAGTMDPAALAMYGFYNFSTGASNAGVASTNFTSGYLAPVNAAVVAATPEPTSLVLIGTGIVGFAAMARRRYAKV